MDGSANKGSDDSISSPQSRSPDSKGKTRAWEDIRAKLPEGLPLPRGLLLARLGVVCSVIFFAGFAVAVVVSLGPLRRASQLRATLSETLLVSAADLRLVDVASEAGLPQQLTMRLESCRDSYAACSWAQPETAAGWQAMISSLESEPWDLATREALVTATANLLFELRTQETELATELDGKLDWMTLLLTGALILCAATLLLMERTNRAKEKVAALRYRATHDMLTRGLNRAAILALAKKELCRANRVSHALALFVVDLDCFKNINDSYGHGAGDEVIRQSANRLRRNLRIYDAVGRYGGDEFLLLLPDCDAVEARIIAERLRRSFELPMDLGDVKKIVSVSLGGAIYRGGEESMEQLIARADKALYQAKHKGRDAWFIADAPIRDLGPGGKSESSGEVQDLGAGA